MAKMLLPAALIAAVLISGCTGTQNTCPDDQKVAAGDVVTVQYIGMLENGAIFDSGNISFTSQGGEMIEGFDEAVLGMCPGGEKNVTLPPEKAYGNPVEELVYVMPVNFSMERYFTVSNDSFLERFGSGPEIGKTYFDPSIYVMPIRVTEISEGNVTMEKAVQAGFVMNDAEPWPIVIDGMNETHITAYREVSDGQTVETAYGQKTVSVRGGNVILDMNHFLAGKTLVFYIKILGIEK